MANHNITYAMIMNLTEDEFTKFIAEYPNYVEWVKAAVKRTETRKTYPRTKVWNEEKGKYVNIADKSKKPIVKTTPVSFFTLKKMFAEECLNIEKKATVAKETFRDRLANL